MSSKSTFTALALTTLIIPINSAHAAKIEGGEMISQARPLSSISSTTIGLNEFRDLRDVTTLNLCYSLSKKVDYQPAAAASLAAMTKLITERYKGKVSGMPATANTTTGLKNWIAGNILVKASLVCPKNLPATELEVARKIKQAAKTSP
ncbi:hypothetical protein PMIT1342_00812 [Prochlorococcus marinus str. MIT 1342]|uniref:hypothetical protein n=1 Tax=Prochlorococcus TaxID=1218 RepID=UPI0007B365BD|nr:hypothetical protein [Prochlorococcus marinus]KZR82346.1 hypothetical protein PMIT1342_00812 [Prochlorococcus marinus str. MIT 1342]